MKRTQLLHVACVGLIVALIGAVCFGVFSPLTLRAQGEDPVSPITYLIKRGQAYAAQGQYAEAMAQYQAALGLAREMGDRTGEGMIRNNIGLIYHSQARYAEAVEQYQAALAIAREVGDRTGEGRTLNNLGGVYDEQGQYAEALKQYQAALALRREVGNRAGEGVTRNNIGKVYHSQGRYVEALEQYEAALTIAREVGDRTSEGRTLNNIGEVYRAQGRYGESIEQYQAALAIRRQVGNRSGEGTTLNNMGEAYREQGRYTEALEQYEAALAIWRAVGNRASEGTILNNIGAVYNEQGRYAEALEQYQAALAIAREVGDRAGEGVTLNNIGRVYDSQRRYAEALEQYQAALTALGELGDRAGEGLTIYNIGRMYRAQGRLAEALEQYETALTIVREVGGRTVEGTTLGNIAEAYEEQSRYADALTYYKQSIDVFEQLRATAGSETARASFIAQYTGIYDGAIRLHLRQGEGADAFLVSERGRARAFLDSLATGQVELSDNAATDLLFTEQEAYTMRWSAQDALAEAKALNPVNPQLVGILEQQLAAADAAYARALAAIRARRDQLSALVPGRSNNVLSVTQVQALLDPQTTLVSYWMLDDRAAAFVVTADDFTVVELPEATTANVTTTVQSLYAWTNKENPHPRPLRNLYKWLVEPLVGHLHTPHVAIVPHQELNYVPFAALTDGESYFGEEHILTLLPSASALRFLADSARKADSDGVDGDKSAAVVFGNPKTDLPGLADLPSAEAEANAVAILLDAPVYTGVAASELELRKAISGTSILHLAAHGGYDPADPLASLIALAPGGGEDGRLETREIFGLPLAGSSLMVLSACETNLGQLSRGDEVVGLTRAFFFAGAPTVVSSLWSVNDAATERLMLSFYEHWLNDDMTKAEALQAAQADVRTDPRWVSPFYWAAFALNGYPGV